MHYLLMICVPLPPFLNQTQVYYQPHHQNWVILTHTLWQLPPQEFTVAHIQPQITYFYDLPYLHTRDSLDGKFYKMILPRLEWASE